MSLKGKHLVIEVGGLLAEGSQSRIYNGKFDDREVVVKRLQLDEKLLTELDILRKVNHHNVIKYLFKDSDDDFIYIVLEKCKHTLKEVINDGITISLTPYELLQQIVQGLDYLHNTKELVHRDLKPSNILLALEDDNWLVKISDFGISKQMKFGRTSTTLTSVKGTVGFIAPELLKGHRIRKESDIFSLGIVFYYVLSRGHHPFGDDIHKINADIRDGVKPQLDAIDDEYVDMKELVTLMIENDPKKRPDIMQVHAHYIFWDDRTTLNFLSEASDYLEDRAKHQSLISDLERGADKATGKDWRKSEPKVDGLTAPAIKAAIDKLPIKKCKVQDLLRLARNWNHHYDDRGTAQEFRDQIGPHPGGVVKFFKINFPKLLPRVHEVIKKVEGNKFEKYYTTTGSTTKVGKTSPKPEKCVGRLPRKPVLRNYQKELAEQALKGDNSMIVAPTGSGKTTVAYAIMEKKLMEDEKHILFFATKTALAQQQYKFFHRKLDCTVTCIIGRGLTSASNSAQQILKNRVTVLTPQILINELKRKPPTISFNDISQMIFDECHNAIKGHPYNVILEMLLDFQSKETEPAVIQIIGLTASPGVGKTDAESRAAKNLLSLMANLNIKSKPSLVQKNIEELRKHQNEIAESLITVTTKDDAFSHKVVAVMSELEKKLADLAKDRGVHIDDPPIGKAKQAYEKWTKDVSQHVTENIHDPDLSRTLKTYSEHLNMYYDLLILKDVIPNAIQHTKKSINMRQTGDLAENLKKSHQELEELSKEATVPMVEKLFEILKREFNDAPYSRCLVFVQRKLVATCIVQAMKDDRDLVDLKPMCLLGANESPSSGGMTKAEQENSLEAFRNDKCKVLVATSVAEEGLDIRECNLVISYYDVTGEVGRIQREGRCRAENGKYILLTLVGSDHMKREQDNRLFAEATDRAIEEILTMSDQSLSDEISKIQNEQKRIRQLREAAIAQLPKDHPTNWDIHCAGCKTFITAADKLRDIENMHTVVKDADFESRVTKRVGDIQKGPVRGTADYLCKTPECQEKLALNMVYESSTYPTLSLKKLVFLDKSTGKFCTVKKKKNLPFHVDKSVTEPDETEEFVELGPGDFQPTVVNEAVDIASMDQDDVYEFLDVTD